MTPNPPVDPLDARLAPREDLIFTPRLVAGERVTMVEDPLRGKFHHIGAREYALLCHLDGRRSLREALRLAGGAASRQDSPAAASTDVAPPDAALPTAPLTAADAQALARWLAENELLRVPGTASADKLARRARELRWRRRLAALNPFFVRVPLLRPRRLLDALLPATRWCFSTPAVAAMFALWATALAVVLWRGREFWTDSARVLSLDHALSLTACALGLKLLHELAHGLACHYHGGSAREAGVALVLLTPMPYVDVTSSWRFSSKAARMHVSAAGMQAELTVAALAVWVWLACDEGPCRLLCVQLAGLAAVVTLLFNANPLMRFDGYYLLSDWFEVPNLAALAQRYMQYLGRRHVLGENAPPPRLPRRREWLVRAYAPAAAVWKVMVSVSMIAAAAALLHGAGVLLAAAAIALWIGWPMLRTLGYMLFPPPSARPRRARLALLSGAALGLASLLGAAPWPAARWAPVIVEFEPLAPARAGAGGFVQEIRARDGQRVEAGEVLAELVDPELGVEIIQLELAASIAEHKALSLRQRGEMAQAQAELSQQASLLTQAAEKRRWAEHLLVKAPCAGQVLGRGVADRAGQRVAAGDTLCLLGANEGKVLEAVIPQDDLPTLLAAKNRQASLPVWFPAAGWLSCRLIDVEPSAGLAPRHVALCAPHGGLLPVVEKPAGPNSEHASPAATLELLTPHVVARLELTPDQAALLRAGQRGQLKIPHDARTIGQELWRRGGEWLERKFPTLSIW